MFFLNNNNKKSHITLLRHKTGIRKDSFHIIKTLLQCFTKLNNTSVGTWCKSRCAKQYFVWVWVVATTVTIFYKRTEKSYAIRNWRYLKTNKNNLILGYIAINFKIERIKLCIFFSCSMQEQNKFKLLSIIKYLGLLSIIIYILCCNISSFGGK
jgi:hypothetical protein